MSATREQEELMEFLDVLVETAEMNAGVLEGLSRREQDKHVRTLMNGAELVYAVWDAAIGRHVVRIKGIDIPEGNSVKTTAIFVRCEEDALALRRKWGDGPPIPLLAGDA